MSGLGSDENVDCGDGFGRGVEYAFLPFPFLDENRFCRTDGEGSGGGEGGDGDGGGNVDVEARSEAMIVSKLSMLFCLCFFFLLLSADQNSFGAPPLFLSFLLLFCPDSR